MWFKESSCQSVSWKRLFDQITRVKVLELFLLKAGAGLLMLRASALWGRPLDVCHEELRRVLLVFLLKPEKTTITDRQVFKFRMFRLEPSFWNCVCAACSDWFHSFIINNQRWLMMKLWNQSSDHVINVGGSRNCACNSNSCLYVYLKLQRSAWVGRVCQCASYFIVRWCCDCCRHQQPPACWCLMVSAVVHALRFTDQGAGC